MAALYIYPLCVPGRAARTLPGNSRQERKISNEKRIYQNDS